MTIRQNILKQFYLNATPEVAEVVTPEEEAEVPVKDEL